MEASGHCSCFLKKKQLATTDQFPFLIFFSKLFELVIKDHISHYLKFKLNPCQHGFTKSKSTVTNLVSYLESISPLVTSQGRADAIYFDLSSAFDLVPHTPLLHKLSIFGLSDDYVNWFLVT
jgi:hypothetical protein